MKKILVTGGAGFIGSNFIRYILNKYPDYSITNLDKLTYAGRLENLQDIADNPRYKFIKGDICDSEKVAEAMEKCQIVLNFAAETHVDRSIISADAFIYSNFVGLRVLLEEAKKQGIEKFVQISTDEVYGQIFKGKFKETDRLNPRNPYSATKAAGELLAMSYFYTYGLPVIITRSSNNFGPYQFPEKLISLFITNLLRGKKVPLYGSGKNVRDWIYVLDNCEGIDFVLHCGKIGEIYNIGGGNEKENIELTKIILKQLNKDESWIKYVPDRLGHDWRYALDCSKIKKLGWQPKYKFEKAIAETIDWYKNNQWWWES